jgi:uncharacterized membrane protein YeaQ/YmgE (transglycosylase-associated protein family)
MAWAGLSVPYTRALPADRGAPTYQGGTKTDEFVAFARIGNLGFGIGGWIVVGLIAGWLGLLFARGESEDLLMDVILGLVGALIGGVVLGFIMTGTAGLWVSLAVAFVIGLALAWLVRGISERAAM